MNNVGLYEYVQSTWMLLKALLPVFQRYVKKKSNPITGLNRPTGFQEVEVPRFQDSRHMNVARLSALRTGRFLPPGNIPSTHFF